MKNVLLWFRIVRPQTLFASLCPVIVALLTMNETVVSWTIAWVTIVCALGLQILSNLINDYYDFVRGTDKKGRAGFKRALAEGEVSENQMRRACLVTLAICMESLALDVFRIMSHSLCLCTLTLETLQSQQLESLQTKTNL